MRTLYYRKIAEIVLRDESGPEIRAAAERALATGRGVRDTVAKRDRGVLRAWMLRWCDAHSPSPAADGSQ